MCECMCVHNRIMFPTLAGQQTDRMSWEQSGFPNESKYTHTHKLLLTPVQKWVWWVLPWFLAWRKRKNKKGSTCPCRSVPPEWLSQWLGSSCCGPCLRTGCCSIGHIEKARRDQWRAADVISSSGVSLLTVEGVGVFLWSPEIRGLGGTLLELPELPMCLLSPWGRLLEMEPVVEGKKTKKTWDLLPSGA